MVQIRRRMAVKTEGLPTMKTVPPQLWITEKESMIVKITKTFFDISNEKKNFFLITYTQLWITFEVDNN